MNPSSAIYLAIRSLWWFKWRALTIVLCLALTIWLPITVRLLLNQFRAEIISRAESTPLVVGAKGSQIDLALHALYFDTVAPQATTMSEANYIQDSGFATPVPVHVNYKTQSVNDQNGVPIVGTTVEYFEFRNLNLQSGNGMTILGDCVIGSNVAESMQLAPGDQILSAPKNAFNLAGSYPLKMNIVGVLAPSYSPDDNVVFVDVKTAWIIDGIGHGHQSVTHDEVDQNLLLKQEGDNVTASAAVLPFTEITVDNIDSFHFHGDEDEFPISAVIAVPANRKNQTLLLGRYANDRKHVAQCVKPAKVVHDLLSIVLRVEQLIWVSSMLSVVVTALLVSLVLLLSIRLRAGEMKTMFKLGGSRATIASLLGAEILAMILMSAALALFGAWATQLIAADSLRTLLF